MDGLILGSDDLRGRAQNNGRAIVNTCMYLALAFY